MICLVAILRREAAAGYPKRDCTLRTPTGGRAATEDQAGRCHRGEHGDHRAVDQGGPVQADMGGGHPGDHDGDAERHVGRDEVGGDQAGSLAGSGLGGDGAEGAEHCGAEARARHRGAGEEGGPRCRLDRGQGHHGAGEQGQAAGQHGRGPAGAAEHDRGRGTDPVEQEDHQAAPQQVRRAEYLRGQRRSQRQVEPADHPHRDQARQGPRERPPRLPRHGHPRPQRGQDTRPRWRGLRHRQHGAGSGQVSGEQQPPDQMGGRRRVLDERAGAQPADGQAQQGGGGGDHRRALAALGLQVDQRGAEGAGRGADGGPVQRPGGEQQPDAVRRQEQPAGTRGHRQAARITRRRPR